METRAVTTVKKAPTLNDSRFHTNNTLNGIKALQKWKEKGKVTPVDAILIEDYLIKRRADKDLSQGRVNKILWTLLSWRRFVPEFDKNTIKDIHKGIDALKNGHNKKRDVVIHPSTERSANRNAMAGSFPAF